MFRSFPWDPFSRIRSRFLKLDHTSPTRGRICGDEALNSGHVTINKSITRATTGVVFLDAHEPVTFRSDVSIRAFSPVNGDSWFSGSILSAELYDRGYIWFWLWRERIVYGFGWAVMRELINSGVIDTRDVEGRLIEFLNG